MKLTDKNKKILLVGGAGITLAYLLAARSGDGQEGFGGGGFGGGGALTGDVLGDAEDSSMADTIINYNLPTPETGFAFESPFGEDPVLEEEEGLVKKVATEPVIKDSESILGWAGERAGGVSNLPPWEIAGMTTTHTMPEEINPYERYQKPVATKDIFNWNLQDASNNVGNWLLGTKGNVVNEQRLTKKAVLEEEKMKNNVTTSKIIKPSAVFAIHAKNMSRIASLRKVRDGYSNVRKSSNNPRGVPGWKQVGAKKPTGPGQPDRY